jgi:hypothetical protein
MAMHQIEALRSEVARAVQRGSHLIADLDAVSARFPVVMPSLGELTETERWATVARLCGVDATVREQLGSLVENLADVLAGLTTTDGGAAWLEHRLASIDASDDERAAA